MYFKNVENSNRPSHNILALESIKTIIRNQTFDLDSDLERLDESGGKIVLYLEFGSSLNK